VVRTGHNMWNVAVRANCDRDSATELDKKSISALHLTQF
jgi:hypothetical protein